MGYVLDLFCMLSARIFFSLSPSEELESFNFWGVTVTNLLDGSSSATKRKEWSAAQNTHPKGSRV